MDGSYPINQHYLFEQSYQADISSINELFSSQPLLMAMMEHSMDGITVVTPEYDVVYMNEAMKQWYSLHQVESDRKCYSMFHGSDEICMDCPVAKSMIDLQPNRGTVPYMNQGVQIGFLDIYAVPVLDADSNVIGIIEYTHNISLQMAMEKNLQTIQARFEILQKQNEILESRLEEQMEMLSNMASYVTENIEKYVKPSLRSLKKETSEADVDAVSSVLDTIFKPFQRQKKSALSVLSVRELQVASLIKEGKTSKEIAAALFITKRAVDFHRRNIRQKLKVDSKISLHAFLQEHL